MKFDAPFVLVEDARPGGAGRLFSAPSDTIIAANLNEVGPALERVRAALRAGRYAAGWISYEAGFAFEEKLARLKRPVSTLPLLWFGLFDGFSEVRAEELELALPDPHGAWISKPRPRISQAQYREAFARTQHYIIGGDVYQINLSYRANLTLQGDPLAAYARLRRAGRGGWSGVVNNGNNWLLSTSPELFFRIRSGVIEARPMKGTAKRASDPEEDLRAAQRLRADSKERAENVMIVDLLRNDISRVAEIGSVHVPALFSVETYPTLHTLTSTVRACMGPGKDAVDALRALFPCGSVTGAPKIRAMEIINELEGDARGPYTGSIGWLAPDGDAEFNVAIRTLAIADGRAELGLGSAVVADSSADAEWEECRAKGAFISSGAPEFELIETMRFEPGSRVERLDLHLARLGASAVAFGFAFDATIIRAALGAALDGVREACVTRLTLNASGAPSITFRPIVAAASMLAALAPLPVRSSDFRLRHKTTLRGFYDEARKAANADEVVFTDEAGFLTEGSITNVFVERDGVLLTPPASRGLLPGVLRAALLIEGRAREADLRVEDLAGGFFLGNSVRGLVPARLVDLTG
ncbi:MAG: aminodeoxychorismate synthase component I [Hyphomonadaceae bacterium]|nr:aminodeoxychorismate synthase component I [Hyphomonadaceae bacterium]